MEPSPLGGIDLFHLMGHHRMRRVGLPGNHCAFVAALGGRVEPSVLEERVRRAVAVLPELSFSLERRLFRGPVWAPGRPRLFSLGVHQVEDERTLAAKIEGLLAWRLDGRLPWAFDLLRGPQRDTVVFRWFHPLCDSRAAERLMRFIGAGSGASLPDPPSPEVRFGTSDRLLKKLGRPERVELARSYARHVHDLMERPIVSLATVRPGRSLGVMRAERVTLSADRTRRFDERVQKIARLAETAVMVVAVTRVLDEAFVRRGYAPAYYVIPVPVSLDPKQDTGRFFGNNLAMMLFSLRREELLDEALAVQKLVAMQRDVVRKKLDVAMIAGLDLGRVLPTRVLWAITTHPLGGELASVVFSNPGAFTLSTFAGCTVLDAYPLPAVISPPGFQVIFTRFRAELSFSMVYLDGVVGATEAKEMAQSLAARL